MFFNKKKPLKCILPTLRLSDVIVTSGGQSSLQYLVTTTYMWWWRYLHSSGAGGRHVTILQYSRQSRADWQARPASLPPAAASRWGEGRHWPRIYWVREGRTSFPAFLYKFFSSSFRPRGWSALVHNISFISLSGYWKSCPVSPGCNESHHHLISMIIEYFAQKKTLIAKFVLLCCLIISRT